MKIRLLTALLLCALAVPAWAQTAPRSITMSGQGEVMGTPDTVTLSAGVTVQAATAAAALAANTPKMQGVITALKSQGVADKNIRTTQFSVSPQMAFASGQPPRLTGYQVSNEVSVRLDDVKKLGVTLDALVDAGANQVNSIRFGFIDSASLLAQARQQAVADATTRAQTYARAAGVTLGPILSISESGNAAPRPMFMATVAGAREAPPMEAGEESVAANVSIVWEIH